MSFFKRLGQLLFPHICVLCAERSDQPMDLCLECETTLPKSQVTCRRCAVRLPTQAQECGQCQQANPPFDRVMALCDYTEPMDRLITAAKFHQQLIYTRVLGELLAKQVRQSWYQSQPLPSLILPVPLHASRLKKRGYNQTLEIAKVVAKNLSLPFSRDYCERRKATLPQSELSPRERSTNVQNAFALKKPLSVDHVAIVDDIVTTGYTVSELSKQLRQAGVRKIDVWCCARTQQ